LTGSNNFVGNQTITGSLIISSSNLPDLIVTGAINVTDSITSSGSNGQTVLGNTDVTITSNSTNSSALLNRFAVTQISSSTRIGFSANPSQSTFVPTVTNPSIFISSGSSNVSYAPIQFQRADSYTDGRVTLTTPLLVSSSTFISGNLDVSGSLQLQGGSLNFTGSLTVVDGFDFTVNGHKQFNYAFVTSSLDQSGSGTPQAFTGLDIVNGKGITIESGSRVKVTNAGVYKFDAQLQAYPTGSTQLLTRWYKNGNLQPYFEQDSYVEANQFTVVASSMLFDLNANDYIELYWGGIGGGANSGSIQLKQESRNVGPGVSSYVMPGRIFVSQVS
jgi:hypothetical protein